MKVVRGKPHDAAAAAAAIIATSRRLRKWIQHSGNGPMLMAAHANETPS